MTVKTRTQLAADVATLLADNTTGAITPAILRQRLVDIIDSISTTSEINATLGALATDAELAAAISPLVTESELSAALAGIGGTKNNLTATQNPLPIDDTSKGYSIGSLWQNTITGLLFRAISVSAGAAIWKPLAVEAADDWYAGTLLYPDHIEVPTTDPIDGSNLGPFFLPFTIPNKRTLTGIGIHMTVAGAAGSACRLGLYDDQGGLPGQLVVDGGEVTTTATGERWATVNVTLNPGRYWSFQQHKAASTGTHYRVMDTKFNSRVKDRTSGLAGVGHRGYLGLYAPTYGALATGLPFAPPVIPSGSNQMSIVMLRGA